MVCWIFEPGCERIDIPEARMGKAPTMDMREIIRRVIALGAMVEENTNQVAIYPADKNRAPVFLSHKHVSERDLTEALRRLRRSGLDIEHLPEETTVTPRPTDVPPKLRTNGSRPVLEYVRDEDIQSVSPKLDPRPTDLDPVLGMLAESERRVAALADRVALLEAGTPEEDDIRLVMDRLDRRLHALERDGARPVAAKSKAELTRETVLAFFQTLPGVKMSPQLVQANLEGQLPEGLGPTDVASACNDLAKAGQISGRSNRDGANRPRGIYWLEREEAPKE